MPVDKFGHYYNSKLNYDNNFIRKNESKMFSIIVDGDKNLNMQNKRIKNIANPVEENDAVTKGFLFSQINQMETDLLINVNKNDAAVYEKMFNLHQKRCSFIDGELESIRDFLNRMQALLLDILKDKIVVAKPLN